MAILMKIKLHVLYLLASILILAGCTKEKDNSIWINFINTTDNKIIQAKSEEVDLGIIAGNGQTGYKKFDEIGSSSTIPVISFDGTIDGEHLESIPLRCGNGTSSLPPGRYDVLIETVDYGTIRYFTLTLK